MSKDRGSLGRCCICNKKVFEKELLSGSVVYMKGWPGDGYAHVDHTGVHNCYAIEEETYRGKKQKKKGGKLPDV
jgi:hypothetical protein